MPIRRTLLVLFLVPLYFTGCSDDDPTTPSGNTSPWQQDNAVDLGPGSKLFGVDFTGSHGTALGTRPVVKQTSGAKDISVFPTLLALDATGNWVDRPAGGVPAGIQYLDLALDAADSLILAGYSVNSPIPGRIYDGRAPDPETISATGHGFVCVDGEGSFYVAGGLSQGGSLWTSLVPNEWTEDPLPVTGTNDSGFWDVDVRGNTAVACGFDDGADTLQVLLTRTTTTGWEKISIGPGFFGRTFRSVALAESGTIFVGGVQGAGGQTPQAFLSSRSSTGEWTDYVLPEPDQTGMVNDILIASDDSIYLVCSGEVNHMLATIIRADAGGARHEITPFRGSLDQLAEGPDGKIYAVGYQRYGSDAYYDAAVMLVRE